jgi:hypothetical protein
VALVNTTLLAACSASDTQLSLTSTTSYPAVGLILPGQGQPIQIDGEYMYLVSVLASGSIKVRGRGSEGSLAVAHDLLAPVSLGATGADFPPYGAGFPSQRPPALDDRVTIGQNAGTLVIPDKHTTYVITKASAATMTLTAPTVAQNGLRLTFTSQTAAAHVLTATALMNNGLTGSPWTTATFAAFIGAGFTLLANAGTWNVLAAPVTGSTVVLT